MIFGRKKKNNNNLDAFLNETVSGSATPGSNLPEEKIGSTQTEISEKKITQKSFQAAVSPKNDFHNPEILQLDLIRQEMEGRINWRRYFNLLAATCLMSALVIAQIYYIISWWGSSDISSENILRNSAKAQDDIKNLQKTSDEVLRFSKRADLVLPLLEKHIYWTNFFNYLERNTLSNVTFSDFSGDLKGDYTLTAEAKHYSDINWQVKKFLADDYTIAATVSEGSSGDGDTETKSENATSSEKSQIDEAKRLAEERRLKIAGPQSVTFVIKLKVKPEIFYLTEKNGKP